LSSRSNVELIDVNVAPVSIDIHTLEIPGRDGLPRDFTIGHARDTYVSRVADCMLASRRRALVAASDQGVLLRLRTNAA
jgi:hypothetical protein